MNRMLLRLFIAGMTPRSQAAIHNLNRICVEHLHNDSEVEIIDILEHPEEVTGSKIIATPTLIKACPSPAQRIIGDLSDSMGVLLALEKTEESTKSVAIHA